MSPHQIILLGLGDHARLLQLFLTHGGHTVLGGVSPKPPRTADYSCSLEWLGDDAWLAAYEEPHTKLVNGIGSVASTQARSIAFTTAVSSGKIFLDYCHPSATVDTEITTGDGLQILAGAIVQPGCWIGKNVLVNTGAVLEHDVRVGDHAHIAPRACLCGGVRVGESAHVGAGAVVLQGCTIGRGAVVGVGAVVLGDVPPNTTVVGNPARPIRKMGKE